MARRGLYKAAALALLWGIPAASGAERPLTPLRLDSDHWSVAYTGGGTVCFGPEGIGLAPQAPAGAEESHASLLLSRREFPAAGVEIEAEAELRRPLRAAAPRPWETFWLFFQYRGGPGAGSKKANYVLLKSNGIEIGRAWGKDNQSFVLTRENPRLVPGKAFTLRLRLERKRLTVYCNGELVGSLPRGRLFSHPGRIGLYSEDAEVLIRSVKTRLLVKKLRR